MTEPVIREIEVKSVLTKSSLPYVTNDDSVQRPFEAPPVVVNYFYHEQIKKPAKR